MYCCVYSEKLLIMDRGIVRNMQSSISKNKFEKLVHLVGFIIRRNLLSLLWCDAVQPDICVPALQSNLLPIFRPDYTASYPTRQQSVLDLQRTCDSLLCTNDGMTQCNTRGYPSARNKVAIIFFYIVRYSYHFKYRIYRQITRALSIQKRSKFVKN